MFIAMNRFRVRKGSEDAFEQVWLSRDTHLDKVPGFVEFHLLRGPEAEEYTLFASHTVWASQDDFIAWTKSENFRAAHRNAGGRPEEGHSSRVGAKSQTESSRHEVGDADCDGEPDRGDP